jgi:serine/threonine-protein kinase HipA
MYEDSLNVWCNGQHVGYLWRDDRNEMGFQYSDEWLENPVRFPVSLTLPLRPEPYEAEGTKRVAHHFFANLLPEADSRRRICREKGISEGNDFELLRAIGGECAGALSIAGDEPERAPPEYQQLNDGELTELLTKRSPLAVVEQNAVPPRFSLAGAQDKVPVKYEDGQFFIPLENAVSTHILKYRLRDVQHVPAYETITVWVASELNLGTCEIDFHTHGDESFSLAKRFDRVTVEGRLFRLHQEDFCQASGRSSQQKYEQEGGPAFAECLKLVQQHSTQPLQDIPRLIQWQVFNFLVGNSDAHAKNLSFLYGLDNTARLSPFYDLIAIHAWPSHVFSHRLAMSIGGESNLHKVKRTHWQKLADSCEISFDLFENAIGTLAEGGIDAFERARNRFESKHGKYPAFQQLKQALMKNRKLLLSAIRY